MSGAVPPHPQPQVGAPTGQGPSVLDLWAPQVLRGSEEGQKQEGKNYLESQTTWHMTCKTEAHTRSGTCIRPLGKRKMQWSRRIQQILFSSTHLAAGSQIILLSAQVLASQDKSTFMLFENTPQSFSAMLFSPDLSQFLTQSFIRINHTVLIIYWDWKLEYCWEEKHDAFPLANMNLHNKKQISCEEWWSGSSLHLSATLNNLQGHFGTDMQSSLTMI